MYISKFKPPSEKDWHEKQKLNMYNANKKKSRFTETPEFLFLFWWTRTLQDPTMNFSTTLLWNSSSNCAFNGDWKFLLKKGKGTHHHNTSLPLQISFSFGKGSIGKGWPVYTLLNSHSRTSPLAWCSRPSSKVCPWCLSKRPSSTRSQLAK